MDYLLSAADIKILIASKQGIHYFAQSQNFHLDATYRLIDLGHPVLVLGITDLQNKFILVALAVATHEDFETYKWCTEKLIGEANLLGLCIMPKTIISDSAPQLTALANFSSFITKRTRCWAHVLRNIEINLKGIHQNLRIVFK